jgi:hypothetical protein
MPRSHWLVATSEQASYRMEAGLPRAIEGDYYVLCDLLLYLSEAIRNRTPLTPKLEGFLADALREIAEGGDPKRAFHIQRGRGERDTREATLRAITIVTSVKCLRLEQARSKTKRLRGVDIMSQVAREENVSYDTVKAALRAFGRYVEASQTPGCPCVGFYSLPEKPRRKIKRQKKL